jgi:hypothetical protein
MPFEATHLGSYIKFLAYAKVIANEALERPPIRDSCGRKLFHPLAILQSASVSSDNTVFAGGLVKRREKNQREE